MLDVDHGNSSVIGDRAFHSDPAAIGELGTGLMRGLRHGGMSAVGKHFPGHGHVKADSHHEMPIDDRPLEALEQADLKPFRRLIEYGLGGIMPAHVVYPAVDEKPAGFSAIWLKQILRRRLGFNGMIFSDDLSMEGASTAGGVVDRAYAAIRAGCDMVLVCNDSQSADQLLAKLDYTMPAMSLARLARIHGRGGPGIARRSCSTTAIISMRSQRCAQSASTAATSRSTASGGSQRCPPQEVFDHVPRLSAPRRFSRRSPAQISGLPCASRSAVRRRAPATVDNRPGARHAWREPQRTSVHGRLRRHPAVRNSAQVRFRNGAAYR